MRYLKKVRSFVYVALAAYTSLSRSPDHPNSVCFEFGTVCACQIMISFLQPTCCTLQSNSILEQRAAVIVMLSPFPALGLRSCNRCTVWFTAWKQTPSCWAGCLSLFLHLSPFVSLLSPIARLASTLTPLQTILSFYNAVPLPNKTKPLFNFAFQQEK